MTFQHEVENEQWLLTGLDMYDLSDDDADHANKNHNAALHYDARDGKPRPLVEFHCPPAPKLIMKHKYYSLARNETLSTHYMSEWEKQALLRRLNKVQAVDIEAFQQRLSHVRLRNSGGFIAAVQERGSELDHERATERELVFLEGEARRNLIYYRHAHLLHLRRLEKFIYRARAWYRIIVSHVFLTALIQERKVQEALDTFAHLMAPMVRRFVTLKRKRRAAEELTRRHLRDIPLPTPSVIQSMYGTFFEGWPPLLLEQLTSNAKPMYYKKGTYLMHEGDIGRNMFMITTGEVSIILRKKGKDKRRTKANSNGVIAIQAPCYVGEFALVCKEPRSASIYCETDIGFWSVLPEDYERVARHLSPAVASRQREATDVRRRQNLKKFFPLKVEFLRRFAYFSEFSEEGLLSLIEQAEPIVLHDGDYLYRAGEMDSSVYFIQDGVAMLHDDNASAVGGNSGGAAAASSATRLSTGSCVGMFECACGVNERKRNSIVSVNYCDIWRLRRESLTEVGLSEPAALLLCRQAAKQARAREMRKEPKTPAVIRNNAFLNFCVLTANKNAFYELCSPSIFLNGERLTLMGQDMSQFIVLVNGTVDLTYVRNVEQEVCRVHITDGEGTESGKSAGAESDAMHGFTCVLGAYEFAAALTQYTCTAVSVGLTEAFVVDRAKFEESLPVELRTMLHDNLKAREVVKAAHNQRKLSLLETNKQLGFATQYRTIKEREREKAQKRERH